MLEALNYSDFAQWLIISRWAYPTFLTLHGLGMAVVVGLTVMIGLRVLGFPRQVPLGPYIKTVPLGIGAFIVNAASGTALFTGDAIALWENPSFQIKLISIVVGMIALWLLLQGPVRKASRLEAQGGIYVPTTWDKTLAVVSILIWSSAVIVSGRLIAYMAPTFF